VSLQKRLKDGMDVLSFASYERERERERGGERERTCGGLGGVTMTQT